ncbi:MAG: hypothetical protein AB1345_12425 [Chloroflexota bacterium]
MSTIKFYIFLILVLSLAACNGIQSETSQKNAITLSDSYEGALTIETQLVIGTLKLEGTDLAVTSEQASVLLPLWKAYQSLSTSDTAATEEFTALINQIEESMTNEQIEYIAALELKQEDMFSLIQELGLLPDDLQQSDSSDISGQGGEISGGGSLPEGAPSGGGPGFIIVPGEGGMGGGDFGQNLNPEQFATLQAERGSRGNFNNRTSILFLNNLIELLKTRAES